MKFNFGSKNEIRLLSLAKKLAKIYDLPLKINPNSNNEIDYYVPNLEKISIS